MVVKINGNEFEFGEIDGGVSIVEFAHRNGIEIPTLCFLKDCSNVAKCGLCSVIVNDKKVLACNTEINDGDEIQTAFSCDEDGKSVANVNAPELSEVLQKRISMLLDKHDFSCGKCNRKDSCEFLKLVQTTKARANERYAPTDEEKAAKIDERSVALTIDRNKCVLCSRCVATCSVKTTTQSIAVGKLPEEVGEGRGVCPALKGEDGKPVLTDKSFDETNCLLCGQCSLACPVAAISEKDDTEKVVSAIEDENKFVVVAMAPAVRTALGESFGLEAGTDVTGKIYSACREIGFDKVWDINFAADVTIMEEGTELLQRLGVVEGGHSKTLPMFTSCCPGWMRLVNNFHPELLPNISSTKSPQEIFGAAVKNYFPLIEDVKPENIFTVTIMPCTAKKYEATLYETANGLNEIDAVLTTREFARLIKAKKIDFVNLPDSAPDSAMGEYTGAATIFGVTGGVMEAALRSAKDIAEGKDLEDVDYQSVRGFTGLREATVNVAGTDLQVAVVNGSANFFKLKNEGNLDKYHFVEVMACPGGCVNGGGQPHVSSHAKLDTTKTCGHNAGFEGDLPFYVAKRASVLRKQDENGEFTDQKRKSHQNQSVTKMYEVLGVKPGEGIAHDIFHTNLTH